ncbi:MAG: arylesterase [Gallionellaceae bacterium]|nr:arylesterase [Gallionellaceae bacterium]MDD5366264.1 arylesterase [Gallionellaceae bacterium]
MSRLAETPISGFSRLFLAGLLVLLFAACSRTPSLARLAPDDVVLAFGDSLTAGVGAEPDQAYPAQLASLIGRQVVNAGVSGETTAEGLARLGEQLDEHSPRLLLLCLGGNDMLRHQPAAATAANLRAMVRLARDRGVAVVLIGVPQPSLLGGAPAFYKEIAREFGLAYEGEAFVDVLHDRQLKSDLIHANAEGYRRVAERLAGLLREAGAV